MFSKQGEMAKQGHVLAESSNRARVSPYPLRSSRTNKNKAPESSNMVQVSPHPLRSSSRTNTNKAPEPSNRVRVSPYPLRSSRTNKNKAPELSIQSELEDVRCVICMEPPHNAVFLTCSSSHTGCRPYMCDTSARHSNCFKQFCKKNEMKEIIDCPLCRGEVLKTTKVTNTARTFMNAKPKSCPIDDCEFSGPYSQLDKHLKTEHPGVIQPKFETQRQRRWEELVRLAANVERMNASNHIPHIHYIPALRVNIVNGAMQNIMIPTRLRNDSAATDNTASHMPRV